MIKCEHCSSYNTLSFFVEHIPCSHCEEVIEVSYNVCQDCGLVWKTVDGELLDGVIFAEPELGGMIDESYTAIRDIIRNSEPEAPGTMNEVIHKCLRCGTLSYEVEPQLYHCPDCGFEWEIL